MASNYVQPGKTVTLTAPYQRDTGLGALVGSIFGVALQTVANGVEGEFGIEGVWTLAKTSAQAWTQGQKIYWDNSNKRCDSDSTVGMLIGVALEAADNPSSTGVVRLNGSSPSTAEGPQAAIVALTDSTGLSGTHDDTLAATSVPAAITGGESPTEAEHNALRAVVEVMAQNASDIAQKVLEIRTALIAAGIIAA
jgi:predicted RecA/RadA family phage recombinase